MGCVVIEYHLVRINDLHQDFLMLDWHEKDNSKFLEHKIQYNFSIQFSIYIYNF